MSLAIKDQELKMAGSAQHTGTRTGGQIICEALLEEGVTTMFGYPGGAIMPFYDTITQYPLRHILVRHEQAAAHAADGFARVTGKVGVCIATSGPGATNLVTGLATAFMDSIPIVAITGQVALPSIGKDAFQETDVLGVTQPVTKHNFLVERIEDLEETIHAAFELARSGRPGPVLVDIPKDIQLAKTDKVAERRSSYAARTIRTDTPEAEDYTRAAEIINNAGKPVILAGHGIILSQAYSELKAFAEKADIPVITTLLGISAIPEDHPLYLGMPGMHGPAHANRAISESDVLVAVGMRFDDRVTGKVSEFAPKAQIIHMDIDHSEIGKVFKPAVGLVVDARKGLVQLTEAVSVNNHSSWLSTIASWKEETTKVSEFNNEPDAIPDPREIFAAIQKATNGQAIVVTDVGQHQMWAARFFGFTRQNSHITSGGLGTMGFSLPAAMGAKLGSPADTVWVIAGDGGIQMNIQELATLANYGIEVKVAILNNGYLGMVRQWQQFFHSRNYSETPITGPDYEKLADAYGLKGYQITRSDQVENAVKVAMETPGTVILDFVINSEANVYPMVAPGSGIANMIMEPEEEE